MRLRISCIILALVACMATLYGCSRESSIVENPRLRNNHSIVFGFDHPFENAEGFVDSILHMDLPADSISDTITVTVNDSVYFIGFLPLYAEKIYRFEWILPKDSSDTVITSANTTVQSWAFSKEGVYFPIFRAVDGNNAIDTAGIHRRALYIRVIDTPPMLDVPRDTVRARHKKPAKFNVRASDSCGTIKSFKIDLDASGKDSAKVWKTEKIEGTDSLTLTIPYNKDAVDLLGNQTIYVIAIDDDGNETLDTVYLHFNQLPTIEMLQPVDNASLSNKKRQALYYRAEDKDNPGSLRYYIRMAKSPDGRNPPIFTDPEEALVASNIIEKSFEIIEVTPDSIVHNKINLAGIIYWDVWVTDGYDTVYAQHIKENGKERPWKFYLGSGSGNTSLDNIDGNLWGYAKYQGWTGRHNTIRITAEDTLGNKFYTHTNAKGVYDINLKPGVYSIRATDTSGYYFADTVIKKRQVFPDDTLFLDTMVLRDTAKPVIKFEKVDTLTTRDFQFAFKLYDLGSQVASATGWLDGKKVEPSYFSTNSWSRNETALADGAHVLKLVVKDSAGLVSDTARMNIFVDASSISLAVNGKTSVMINEAQSFNFTVKVNNAQPMPDSIFLFSSVNDKVFRMAITDSVANISIAKKDMEGYNTGVFYNMQAKTSDSIASNVVRFGFYNDGPAIYFESPTTDTTISINDIVNFEIFAFANNSDASETSTITWNCDGATPCIENNVKTGTYSWTTTGTKKLIVTIKNADLKTVSDTLTVNVVADPPTIHVTPVDNDDRHKINSMAGVTVSASDKFGTINKIDWGCSNGTLFVFDDDTTFASPAKSVSNVPVSLRMAGTATNNFRCIVRVTDDDGQTASDTLSFRVLQDLPYISINKKNLTLTIKDQTKIDFVAMDTLGTLVDYKLACDSVKKNLKNNWTSISADAPTVTMPPEACTWYCAIQVTDDDGNMARDTATFTVLQDPPTVEVLGNYTVTIKDTIRLDAIANDRYGEIALYEWGCGGAGATNIGFTYSSTTSPSFSAIMPATAQNGYRCIIRVTDDDGNTARDTTFIDIILAPPTVIVNNKSAIVREGYNIVLNATAYDYPDYPGTIEKREWSCGAPSEIDSRWKTVSQFDTVWKAPAATATFYCIARVTDNDGNMATDTMNIRFSTELPIISVKDDEIYISAGDAFELNATVNDVWQGISWFTWECFDETTNKSLEKKVVKYDYYKNGESFYDFRDGEFTSSGKNMYCVVTAEESSTKVSFADTTHVKTVSQLPAGVITAADTVYPWSGDESFGGEVLYFYTPEWGGMNSTLGTIGNADMQDFWWNFSNVDGNYYQGNRDGTLDTSTYEFNSAFIRSTRENSMTICLDYRDSSAEHVTQSFYAKHRAEEICHKVYFRKAWRNQAAEDTVLEFSKMTTAPALATVGNKPAIAYLKDKLTVKTSYLDGTWKALSTTAIQAEDSITALKMAGDGTNLYLAVLTSAGDLSVYKSQSGTSAWANIGTAIEDASNIALVCHPTTGNPLVSYIKKSTKAPAFSRWDGSAWVTADVSSPMQQIVTVSNCRTEHRKTICDTTRTNTPLKMRELQPAYLQDGALAFVFVDTTSTYQSYYTLYGNDYTVKKNSEKISTNVNGVSLASDGSTLYMGFLNRDTEKYGPYVYKGSVSSNSISWTKSGAFGESIHEGLLAYHIKVSTFDGKLYAIVDDKGKPSLAQSHVFYLDGNTWKLMGENELPYFKTTFYNYNKYYLRGSVPDIAVAANGKVYISMLAWENAGGRGKNFGPIVMKYVADTWTVTDHSK